MLKSISISYKLLAAFAAVILVATAMMSYVYSSAREVAAVAESNERNDEEQALAARVEESLVGAVANLRGYEVTRDPADLAAYRESIATFAKTTKELRPLLHSAQEQAFLDTTLAAEAQWRTAAVEPVLSHVSAADAEAAQRLAAAGNGSHGLRELVAGAEALRTEKNVAVEKGLAEMDTASRHEEIAILLGAIAMLAVGVGLWLILRQLLGKPVVALTGTMNELARGNNEVSIPDAGRGDELGDMARAVVVFRDAAIAKAAADRAKAIADAEQKLVVDTLAAGLGKLSDGDLTVEIGDHFPASYASVRTNFNDALSALRTLIGSVMESASTIRGGTDEIADAAEHLARRTQANAASLEETTGAITQMDSRLKTGVAAASRTVQRADDAIATVRGGREVTDSAVRAMTRVSDSAKGIDDVIEGLDKIAFQTRVLAMNAAVEAGRAGEAGRGFAVVADLVSALAMRAEGEAGRAREQLSVTQNDIHAAVDAVHRVDGALASISEGVSDVHALLGTMAADNEAQSLAVHEITDAVTVMDRATQQNAAMVEETSAAARTLTQEVHSLVAQASRFKIEMASAGRGVVRSLTGKVSAAVH